MLYITLSIYYIMTLDNILIIVISIIVACIITYLFFKFLLPIIIFLIILVAIYGIISKWNDERKYQY